MIPTLEQQREARTEASFLTIGYQKSAHGTWVPSEALDPCDACGALVTDGEYEDFHSFGPCRVGKK